MITLTPASGPPGGPPAHWPSDCWGKGGQSDLGPRLGSSCSERPAWLWGHSGEGSWAPAPTRVPSWPVLGPNSSLAPLLEPLPRDRPGLRVMLGAKEGGRQGHPHAPPPAAGSQVGRGHTGSERRGGQPRHGAHPDQARTHVGSRHPLSLLQAGSGVPALPRAGSLRHTASTGDGAGSGPATARSSLPVAVRFSAMSGAALAAGVPQLRLGLPAAHAASWAQFLSVLPLATSRKLPGLLCSEADLGPYTQPLPRLWCQHPLPGCGRALAWGCPATYSLG